MLSSSRISTVSKFKAQVLIQGGGGAAQYTAATAGEGRADVRLHNPDAELDFEDRVADHDDGFAMGAHRETRACTPNGPSAAVRPTALSTLTDCSDQISSSCTAL